jgi:uroporphyrin-III C-methyltransferase/precorrin-2 dehydrogenase/sirohydrochlorin ferrochelatase
MQRLGEADVVLHDRLVSREVLALARRDADLVAVGKQAGGKGCPQESIHDTLVALARRGFRVVRLKGGDPFVFGRGGEELAALRAAGIEWEVVPGITAAMGCAAATGLPLTYRDLSESVVFVTAHGKDQLAKLDWHLLAGTRQTVALYMGVGRAEEVRSRLLRHGRSSGTPVAIVENGTTPDQFVAVGTLARLPELLDEHGIRSPALIYIGETAALIEPDTIHAGRCGDEPGTDVWSPLALAG